MALRLVILCWAAALLPGGASPTFRKVFTSCGASGHYGPSQTECDAHYGNTDVTVPTTSVARRGYQIYTVTTTGDYMILAAGAAGGSVGSGEPGKGAVISAKFSLTSGTQLVMVVGQKGEDSDQCDDGGGGGGGGTFVAILDQGTDQMAGDVPADLQSKMVKPLLVAGGGGGNDDDAFWNCQQVSADGMDGGLDSSGGSAAYDGGGCNSNGAGFRGDDANNGYPKTFLTGAYAQEQTSWRESGGFGGGAASCNGGGGGGGFWGGRTSEVGLVMGGGKCTTSGGWDTSVCTSGGTSYMASEGANFQAHGAQSKCNGYVIIESCTDATCAASGIPTAGFGGGCSWWPETITSTTQTITSQTTTSHTVTATRVSLEPTVLLSGVAVASLSPDGSVRAWGEAPGADTTSPSDVTSSLASGVVALRAVGRDAFAAMKDDGSVISSGVVQLEASNTAFAVVKDDGSALSWGAVVASLPAQDIVSVTSSGSGFAVLTAGGGVLGLGHTIAADAAAHLGVNVVSITGSCNAYAALKTDGSLVTWGGSAGGDSSAVASHLTGNVERVIVGPKVGPEADCRHMAAMKADGTGLVWGSDSGIYSNVKDIVVNVVATAVLFNDGTVQVLGDSSNGGDTSAASALSGVETIYRSSFFGFAAVKADGSPVLWGYGSGVALSCCIKEIRSASDSAAALKTDGSVITWKGNNYFFQSNWPSARVEILYDSFLARPNVNAFAAVTEGGLVQSWGVYANSYPSHTFWSTTTGTTTTVTRTRTRVAITEMIVANDGYGGDSSSVSSQLKSANKLVGGLYAFGVLKDDGSALSWGNSDWGGTMTTVTGGQTVSVVSQVSSDVIDIFAQAHAFQALKADGSVVAWGLSGEGGSLETPTDVSAQLTSGVIDIKGNSHAVVALKDDGSIVAWGNSGNGGSTAAVASSLTSGVTSIIPGHVRGGSLVGAMKSDGSAVIWGRYFGVYTNVSSVYINMEAAAILKNDGTVEAMGDSSYGGDSSGVSGLTGIDAIYGSGYAFAAVKADGSVGDL
eukprot:s2050_g14.t3